MITGAADARSVSINARASRELKREGDVMGAGMGAVGRGSQFLGYRTVLRRKRLFINNIVAVTLTGRRLRTLSVRHQLLQQIHLDLLDLQQPFAVVMKQVIKFFMEVANLKFRF